MHDDRADQHAHADGRAQRRGRALLLFVIGVRLRGGQAKIRCRCAASRRGRLPSDAGRRLRWEKLFSERMCRHFSEDFGLVTRVARYHNVYGPFGTYDGGREKAPAAICRKVVQAQLSGSQTIEIWGDGEQRRSFTFIDDCLEGTLRLMESRIPRAAQHRQRPVGERQSVGRHRGVCRRGELVRRYNLDAPKGVRGRNSDNTLIRQRLGWSPSRRLEDGLRETYAWIYAQISESPTRGVVCSRD